VQVNLSHKVSVMSMSTPVVKEGGVVGASFPLDGCVTPTTIKGEYFKVNGLTQSQKWPVGFGTSREVVAWEQGDEIWDGNDGDSPYPLGVLPPDLTLDWELDGDEDVDPSLAIQEAIEEDFHRGVKAARSKTKGRRKLLNMVSSINYNDACAPS